MPYTSTRKQKSRSLRERWPQSDALRVGMGWTEEDLEKPQILVDDVWGESHPGSVHLDRLSKEVSVGIFEAGGRPASYHVTDICDGFAMAHEGMSYSLVQRDIIADLVEIHASVMACDGMVLVSGCDKAVPAHLKALARKDIPSIHVPGGGMLPGSNMATSVRASEVALLCERGEAAPKEVRLQVLASAPCCGACGFMGTASTMQILSEALGMALPTSAVVPAVRHDILRLARAAGKAVMTLVEQDIKPSDILTYEAFQNAI